MIILMTSKGRPQQRYDHRLRDLVRATADVTIATDLGVPRSTARGWLHKSPKVVVSLDVTNLTASELPQEILELRRRVRKLTAPLRLPADSQIQYGTSLGDPPYPFQTALDTNLVTSHTVWLHALKPMTQYRFLIKSKKEFGTFGTSVGGFKNPRDKPIAPDKTDMAR
jgi:hypothetical protein